MSRPMPGQPVPQLELPLVGGGQFDLLQSGAENYSLLLFYRGYHCPICKGQLQDLHGRLSQLSEIGVEPVVISMDGPERAEKAKSEWGLPDLAIAHSLTQEMARDFGLYLTTKVGEAEPDVFCEPGLFLVDKDHRLFFASVQSMPFTRPSLDQLIPAIKYAIKADYPTRGTLP